MPVNCFPLPFDTKISEWEASCETRERLPSSEDARHHRTLEHVSARLGGTEISMIIECKHKIDFFGIPFLFAWFTGLWLASRLEELPAMNRETPFRYRLTASSVASLQDLAKLLDA